MPEPVLFRTPRRRSWPWLAVIALVVAVLVALRLQPQPVEERLVRLHSQEVFGADSQLLSESLPVQATLLDYRSDRLLLLKAQAALQVYPEHTRQLLELFGEEPEFREALKTHRSEERRVGKECRHRRAS